MKDIREHKKTIAANNCPWKRIASVILVILMTAAALASMSGCSGAGSGSGEDQEDGKLKVVTTLFPEYDWVREIAGDKADADFIIDSGVDIHSFQPSTKDILKIAGADVFIYTGGESEEWVEEAIKESSNKDLVVVNLMKLLGDQAKTEEQKEGMQEEEHEEEPETDEHIWLSLKNSAMFVEEITATLVETDPDSEKTYIKNAEDYIYELQTLDTEYGELLAKAKTKTVLFGDRFPFRYLLDDYGIDYFAAFPGCSAETEASFATIKFLSEKVDELKLSNVMVTESSDQKIAKAIIDNTKSKDQKILTMDSMQSKTKDEAEKGAKYIDIMKSDLEVLAEAVGA